MNAFNNPLPALLSLLLLATSPAGADTIELASSSRQNHLIELYTSQGCSSCPPAEQWFSTLKESPRLWRDIVPVAFHVDYWDRLGWKDPYSSAAFSNRQRAYAAEWRNNTVYTPGFALDGLEWGGWHRGKSLPDKSKREAGVLQARSEDGLKWMIEFNPADEGDTTTHRFYVARLGSELTTDIKAGENQGRRLTHDFVVLDLVRCFATRAGRLARGGLTLKSAEPWDPGRSAIAIWVTRGDSLAPVQAVGGWLPAPRSNLQD